MRQIIFFLVIALVVASAASVYNAINPPPAKSYKVVYFGAGDCGACKHWRSNILPEWRSTSAAKGSQLVIKETRFLSQLSPESFGGYNDVWRKASAGAKGVPAFALIDLETNRVAGTYFGVGGWGGARKAFGEIPPSRAKNRVRCTTLLNTAQTTQLKVGRRCEARLSAMHR